MNTDPTEARRRADEAAAEAAAQLQAARDETQATGRRAQRARLFLVRNHLAELFEQALGMRAE